MTTQEPEHPEERPNDAMRRLQDLVAFPREDLQTELKGWLDLDDGEHAADLAKAMLALANFGGGYVLIGFREIDGGWEADDDRPVSLASYSQDAVSGIVIRYAEPPFHCGVYHVEHPESGKYFPVIVVPGKHRRPIRAKRDGPGRRHVLEHTYYIRRPGPRSESVQTAQEWDELIGRCVRVAREELIESFREIVSIIQEPSASTRDVLEQLLGPGVGEGRLRIEDERRQFVSPASVHLVQWVNESRARFKQRVAEREEATQESPLETYAHGTYTVSYAVDGDFDQPDLPSFRRLLEEVQGHETGWPPWLIGWREAAPAVLGGAIEAWFYESPNFRDPAHADFWRAAPSGLLYLLRGYADDSQPERFAPGTRFDVSLPIWEIAPCLLHAARTAKALGAGAEASIDFHVTWEGLTGRHLSTWATPRRVPPSDRVAKQDIVEAEVRVRADRITETLPELMQKLTAELYAVFNFFEPPSELIREELARMRGVS